MEWKCRPCVLVCVLPPSTVHSDADDVSSSSAFHLARLDKDQGGELADSIFMPLDVRLARLLKRTSSTIPNFWITNILPRKISFFSFLRANRSYLLVGSHFRSFKMSVVCKEKAIPKHFKVVRFGWELCS